MKHMIDPVASFLLPDIALTPIPCLYYISIFQDVGKDDDENGTDEGSDEENNEGEGKSYEVDFIVGVRMGKHDNGKEQGKKPEHLFKVR